MRRCSRRNRRGRASHRIIYLSLRGVFMGALRKAVSILPLLFASNSALTAQDQPPSPFVVRGICPGEGCQYGVWTTAKLISLYFAPEGSRIVGSLKPGSKVTAITGELYCWPIARVASNAQPDFKLGDRFFLLWYEGEGYFKAWYHGKMVDLDASTDNYPYPKQIWWAKVQTNTGQFAWARADQDNFTGQCSLAR